MTKAHELIYDDLGRSFSGKSFLSIHDFTTEQIMRVMDLAALLKAEQKAGVPHPILKGKTLGMIFLKPSTRTRISFEVAIWQLGGYGLFLSANDLQLKRGETIADTARVLSRYLDGIMIRTFAHSDVIELAREGSIPIINGLTDLLHPCQVMADLLTGIEKFGDLAGRKLAYIGDGNNMVHSLMYGGAKVGMHVTCACPAGYEPDPEVVAAARADGAATGARMDIVRDPKEAVRGADILYTDVWASMGQEAEYEKRVRDFKGYQINAELVSMANPDCIVMHCLPAHRGDEITDDAADGRHSVLWDEAENRLHAQKAILALTMS
ncbi:MAG: Ornithine carbamoyltransferase [Firmicutes bacterium ADurb.BinA052]|jgi:ornithine carbamoyltransferase|nr:MAG: Ornithine carbamoyltransferase [Firmicutes bacterium ADurb.BinA052]